MFILIDEYKLIAKENERDLLKKVNVDTDTDTLLTAAHYVPGVAVT